MKETYKTQQGTFYVTTMSIPQSDPEFTNNAEKIDMKPLAENVFLCLLTLMYTSSAFHFTAGTPKSSYYILAPTTKTSTVSASVTSGYNLEE